MPEDAVRLQKFLAAGGVDSRRHCEGLILQGRVAVNGTVVTQLGTRVDPAVDLVTVDGRPVGSHQAPHQYVVLHKPEGCLTTVRDDRARPTVFDLLPQREGRLFPVGRLDQDSSGLLLLTDDGELAHRLTHPSFGIEREYRVLLSPAPDAAGLQRLRAGATVQERRVTPASVAGSGQPGEHGWATLVVREGRKREVRLICLEAGYRVLRLVRVRYGPLRLGRLGPGQARRLSPAEIGALRAATNVGG